MKGKRDGKQDDGQLRKCWVFLQRPRAYGFVSFKKQFSFRESIPDPISKTNPSIL